VVPARVSISYAVDGKYIVIGMGSMFVFGLPE
jgi:hypothetical protein